MLKRGPSSGFLGRFRRDRRGVSAVEFALLAPVMVTFYFGLCEFCQGYMAQKRLSHTASAVADLVAQTDTVKKADLDDVIEVGTMVMKPFDATTLTTVITSVTRDANGVDKVGWSYAKGASPRVKGSTVTTIPAGMIVNKESLVMAETTYQYASPVKYLLPAVTKFSSVFYLRPRKSEVVPCTDCPAT